MNHDLENLDVNLAIQELEAGGPGSGCNPEVGHCGRPAGLSQEENDWKSKLSAEVQNYDSEKEFTDSVLIHGTNASQGSKIDFVEPRVGEFTKQFYNDEGVDLKPLAFFHSGDSPISSVAHYATGVGVFTKKETPYLLVTKVPSDAYKVGEDGEVLTLDGDLISHDAPYGTESGDIFSEEGASVIAQIPLKDFHFSSLGDFYRSAKGISAEIDLSVAIKELSSGGPGSGCNPEVGKCGRPATSFHDSEEQIFMRPSDIEKKDSWGDVYWSPKGKAGQVIPGTPVTKEQLPDQLYHVTTNASAILNYGHLLARSVDTEGGLGSSGQFPAVSFTTSLDDAKDIETDLLRAGELARTGDIGLLTNYAREDEATAGLKPGALDNALSSALGTFHVRNRINKANASDVLDAYRQYQWGRESAGGHQNTILVGNVDSFSKINPDNVAIFSVPKSGIPDGALIRNNISSHDFLHEVQVSANVPIKGSQVVYRDKRFVQADIDLDAAVAEIVAASGISDAGKYDFDNEKQIREQMQLIAHYAEEGPTFDPAGKYLCGSCRYRMVVDSGPMDECYTVTGTTKMDTGSCALYVIGNVESEHNPLPMLGRYTQLEAEYAERKNGFGCQNCEFASKAKKPDPDGRKLWCRFFGTHVTKTACCDRESGPDMVLAPGEKK